MSSIPAILGVSEVVLSVADLPRMRKFYIETLGFTLHSELSMEEVTPDPEGQPTITFLKICESKTPLGTHRHPPLLALIDYRRHVYARSRFDGHEVRKSTLNHLAFESAPEDFAAHEARLKTLGIELSFAEFPDLQAHAMFFKDPEGNVLELICHHSHFGIKSDPFDSSAET